MSLQSSSPYLPQSFLLSTPGGFKKISTRLYKYMNFHSKSKSTCLFKGGMEHGVATALNERKF